MGKIGKLPADAQQIAIALVNLKHRAMKAGLYETAHALEIPIQKVGWEMADILEGNRSDHVQDHPDVPIYEGMYENDTNG